MAHESNNPYVRWFVDDIQIVDNKGYKITGWIFHQNREIKQILLGVNNVKYTSIPRPDVEETYPFIVNNNVGFEMIIDVSIAKKPISIILDDGSGINHIGNFAVPPILIPMENSPVKPIYQDDKDVVLNSGFNVGHKNLLVVDDFYADPDLVRDYAINKLSYEPSGYHKGRRSTDRFELNGTKEKLEEVLGRGIKNWHHDGYANCRFQYCTAEDPIVFHCDNQQFAGIVFLSPDAPLTSGTATYQSRVTKARRFNFDEFGNETFNQTFKGYGSEINFYDGSSFDMVDRVANVYNRLVIWDAQTIHAATQYYGSNINDSRFFQLFFFDVE